MGHVDLRAVDIAVGGRQLLNSISFCALPGELIAIVGANGTGKSTLLRVIAGLRPSDGGEVIIDGRPVRSLSVRTRARTVSLIGAESTFGDTTTVREVVAAGRYAFSPWWSWSVDVDGDAAIDAALARVALTHAAQRDVSTLSSGERQRALLALAIAQEARLLLLDEPTAHLDPRYALEMLCLMRGLASNQTTAIVVLHDLNEAAMVADRIAVLGDGHLLAFGAPTEVLNPAILERAYGVRFDRVDRAGATPRVFPKSPFPSSSSSP